MTNAEYEKSCVTAAQQAARFEGEHKLEQCDKAIAVLEASLKRLQEERREIVNRYSLNKCEHIWSLNTAQTNRTCVACGEKQEVSFG